MKFFFIILSLSGLFFSYYLYSKHSITKSLITNSEIVNTNLGTIEYSFEGTSGPVLLVIHGTPGGYDQTTSVTGEIRVLTPSRPGFLRTPISVGKTPKEQAMAYKELIDVLGVDKVVIMGISGGGPSSMEFAALFPERTMGLIAYEAVSYSEDYSSNTQDADILEASDFKLWVQLSLLSFFGNERLASIMLPNPNNRDKLLSKPKNIENLKKVIWSIWPINLRREGAENDYEQFKNLSIPLEDIEAPTLVIHGSEDINVDINHGKEVKNRVSQAEMHIVAEGDHMMSATHSKEIEDLILKFVLEVSKI